MSQVNVCGQCGTRLSIVAVEGLCPKCLSRISLPRSLRQTSSERPIRPPSSSRGFGKFGDYELLEEIGRGGMGAVYKARQQSLKRTVAVKVILSGRFASAEAIQRFRAEAEAAANLQHPNIVAVHEVGEQEGHHYFSMDYVDGRNLAEFIRENPLAPRRAAVYLQRIAAAIAFAHQHGTIHRDLKPSNVLIDPFDEPRIADFGLAKRSSSDLDFTHTGQVIGSPSFLAPEQARSGAKVGPACDIYALGALLYFLLTGRPPFLSESIEETLQQVLTSDPVSPRLLNPSIPKDLETVCLKCLEKEPLRRYRSAEEVSEELQRFLQHQPIHARPISRLEKFWRLCRRRPATVSLSTAVLILFLAGFGGISWQWRQARQNARAEAQARGRMEEALSQLELQRAEDLFRAGENRSGLAYLARVLREHPDNRIAAERLLSALSYRSFALPALKPLEHGAAATDASFSPDGHSLVSAGQDGSLKLWEARTGGLIFSHRAHTAAIHSVRFSPDGRKLVTASGDQTARVWDAQTGNALTGPLSHSGGATAGEWSPDSLKIVTAADDGTVSIWDARTGQAVIEPLRLAGPISFVEFNASGTWIATASWNGVARVWNAENGRPVTPPLEHSSFLYSARFSPDATKLVTACYDGRARLWKLPTGAPLARPLVHENVVQFAAFHPNGDRVVSVSRDHTARLWDAGSGDLLATLKHGAAIVGSNFSSDGQRLLTVATDHTLAVWDVATGEPLVEPILHRGRIAAAGFDPTGQKLVTACADKLVRVWDIRPGQMLVPTVRHSQRVVSARFSPKGDRIVTASFDHTAGIWDARNGQALTKPLLHEGWVHTAAFSPDGGRVLTGSGDGTARVWDSQTGEELLPPIRHGVPLTGAHYSQDGLQIVTTGWDGTTRIWNAQTGEHLVDLGKHADRVWYAEFSPDGRYVATASADGTARLWDAQSGHPLGAPLRHEGELAYCAFSPNGRRLLTGSGDHTARLWDVATGRQVGGPFRHLETVRFCEFSPDGKRIVTASGDYSARIWDAFTGKPLTTPLRHGGEVNRARFSPDGARVVTASADSSVRLWDVLAGKPLSEPLRHEGAVLDAAFSADGRRLVTAAMDGSTRVWELPRVPAPSPSWLAPLAEAVAGQQQLEDGSFGTTDANFLLTLQSELEAKPDGSSRWAKWFLSDRFERTISPDSVVTVAEYIQRQIAGNTIGSLLEALRLSPTNGLALTRLARLLAKSDPNPDLGPTNQAAFYSRLAIQRSPAAAESWWVRAELLDRNGQSLEALEAMQRASECNPLDPAFWNAKAGLLERNDQLEDAYLAYSKAIELSAVRDDMTDRTNSWLNRRKLLLRMNRSAEAQADWLLANKIPPRDPKAAPRLIDLSAYYNAGLDDDWHGRIWTGNNLAIMPKGCQTLGGIEFDIRGIIQLAGSQINQSAPGYPEAVRGIAIQRRCQRLHFLQATGWGNFVPPGTRVGAYLLHYTDGQTLEVPIVNGEDLAEWQVTAGQEDNLQRATVVWAGKNARGIQVHLFARSWNNPRPEAEVGSIDFISAQTAAAPFLIAVSAEP